jgi:hypothetical protein
MSELFVASTDIHDLVRSLISKYHPDLIEITEEIAVIFREQASKSGGSPVLGVARKASPLLGVLSGTDYKFVLELGADVWETLTGKQREALLDHLLCHCEGEVKDEETKYKIVKPDVSIFRENVERYGMWFPREADASSSTDSVVTSSFDIH